MITGLGISLYGCPFVSLSSCAAVIGEVQKPLGASTSDCFNANSSSLPGFKLDMIMEL